jgi:hypothetical protein
MLDQEIHPLPEHKLDMCMETSKASVASLAFSKDPGRHTSLAPKFCKIRDCNQACVLSDTTSSILCFGLCCPTSPLG